MRIRFIPIFIVLVLVILSCRLPIIGDISNVNPQVLSMHLITLNPGATATATPFQPLANTPTPIYTPTPSVTPTPKIADFPGAPHAALLPKPEGLVTILIMGSDYRPAAGSRTDIILLAFLNPKAGTVSVVSFPRDLWVYIPNWQMQRINTAYPHGGFGAIRDTFEYNLGVIPDYFVLTNFNGFKNIINTLGGIEVNTARKLSDSCEIPPGSGTRWCSVGPGLMHMDGDLALWYVRSRYSSSDYDRGRRAQEVLQALFAKMISINAVTRAPELYSQFISAVETNMGLDAILPLLGLASQLGDASGVARYTIDTNHVTPWTTPSGGYVQLPDIEAIQAVLKQAMGIP
ncbi:MAG: LCP family protein [Anaerolineaceae bacterium]|nr:LCP family protein [Anaerolineaceae bacterium]